jgi:hypothetical protein
VKRSRIDSIRGSSVTSWPKSESRSRKTNSSRKLTVIGGSVATGYGQPATTIYDWVLEPASLRDADYRLPDELAIRLRIEKFCDRVTKALYSSKPEPAEFISADKLMVVQILESELNEMEADFGSDLSRKLLRFSLDWTMLTHI